MLDKKAKTARIHALDYLRAIMMLLGLVLHSALTYRVINLGDSWRYKDPNVTSFIFDYLSFLIHLFRMPIFFVVAGFFGALLFYERSPKEMIKNRIYRILFPFLVFLFLLWPLIDFASLYTLSAFAGNINPLEQALGAFSTLKSFLPLRTSHLWFLYYLLFISVTTFGLGLLVRKIPIDLNLISKGFEWIMKKPILRILCLSLITFFILNYNNQIWGNNLTSFTIGVKNFLFHFYFYLFGWLLFKSKHLLQEIMRFDWIYVFLGLILSVIYPMFFVGMEMEIKMFFRAITIWLFIFGITGLFLRYGNKYSPLMRYVSDSSYWVYLLHYALVIFLPALIVEWQIPAIAKFLIVTSSATFICLITYHYFVRATFMGKFLNGKKYPRSIGPINK